jgi:hypothetical protein
MSGLWWFLWGMFIGWKVFPSVLRFCMMLTCSPMPKFFHQCLLLEKSCRGVTGLILKCKECDRRFKIEWSDYDVMISRETP